MTNFSAPGPRRAAVSKRLRFEILRRDNHQCRYCGASAPDVPLTVDHVVPVTLGGGNDPSNLVAACKDCNAGKSSASADAALVEDVAADALRWSQAMQMSGELRARDRQLRLESQSAFLEKWLKWTYTGSGETVELPSDWAASFDRFIAAGLVLEDLLELIPVAMSARCDSEWTYFCGCAWNRVRDAQEVARQLLYGGDGA